MEAPASEREGDYTERWRHNKQELARPRRYGEGATNLSRLLRPRQRAHDQGIAGFSANWRGEGAGDRDDGDDDDALRSRGPRTSKLPPGPRAARKTWNAKRS
jgi:hypothetical protein